MSKFRAINFNDTHTHTYVVAHTRAVLVAPLNAEGGTLMAMLLRQ